MSVLPGEMTACTQLETINISANSFVTLPPVRDNQSEHGIWSRDPIISSDWQVLAELPALTTILASNNYVADVDLDTLLVTGSLEKLDLEQNPLNKSTYEVELQTKVHEDFTITEKAPTRAFSWLKAPNY